MNKQQLDNSNIEETMETKEIDTNTESNTNNEESDNEKPDTKLYRIYRIINDKDDEIYIGSTTQQLSCRMSINRHLWNKKKYTKNHKLFNHFDKHGFDSFSIQLIEEITATDKKEALLKEKEHMIALGAGLNTNLPILTKEEMRAKRREYYKKCKNNEEYKEKSLQRAKEYYENNKEKRKEYYEKNKDKCKKYYEKNKDKIKDYHRKRYNKMKEEDPDFIEKSRERAKEYYEKNKDKVKEYYQKYKEDPEYVKKTREASKAYYQSNKGDPEYVKKLQESSKDYYENNKDKIKEYYRKKKEDPEYLAKLAEYQKKNKETKTKCPCGGVYTKYSKKTHEKSKRHLSYIICSSLSQSSESD